METIYNVIDLLKQIIDDYNIILGLLLAFIIIIFESIIPILPSGLFIALIVLLFGDILGLFICYLGTIIGCLLSYWLKIRYKNHEKMEKLITIVSDIELSKLTILLSFPFTPAFPINIAAGLAKMPLKKFLIACLISKAATVYFWGYVGESFERSIKNPSTIINIVIILIITFIISKIVTKKMKFNL